MIWDDNDVILCPKQVEFQPSSVSIESIISRRVPYTVLLLIHFPDNKSEPQESENGILMEQKVRVNFARDSRAALSALTEQCGGMWEENIKYSKLPSALLIFSYKLLTKFTQHKTQLQYF